jgi:hypothetical protein
MSTAAKTFYTPRNDSKFQMSSTFQVPNYIFKPDDNMFNTMRLNKAEPFEPTAFVLT